MKYSVFNQKGGVGKTSITCNLAAALARKGRKVLVVDLDSQANATRYLLGESGDKVTVSISDFFEQTLSFKLFKNNLASILLKTDFKDLWVLPADQGLLDLQNKLETRYKVFKLKAAIDELIESHDFDDVLFDTPPALNFYSMSALIGSERVLVPFDCDVFSAKALDQVAATVEEIAVDHNSDLELAGVVINQFSYQAKLPAEGVRAIEAKGYKVLKPYISSSVVMRESHSAACPLAFFKPSHKVAEEFAALADLISYKPGSRAAKPAPDLKKSRKSKSDAKEMD